MVSAVADKIRSRAHWLVTIRPTEFVAERVPYSDLLPIAERAAVRFRGWPVPMVDARDLVRGENWVGADVNAEVVSHYEAWRFWTSGQFSQLRSVGADWREGSERTRRPAGFSKVIEVWEVLYYLTEIFELAARLVLTPAGEGTRNVVVEATLYGIDNRALVVGQSNRLEFIEPYEATIPKLLRRFEGPPEQLIAETRGLAVKMAAEFFDRFGWHPSVEQLADHQRELIEGR